MGESKSPGFFARAFGKQEDLPGTTVTKEELADAIGEAIRESFKTQVPQPADMEKAISGAVQEAGKEIAGQVSGVQKQLAETVSSFSQITEKLDATLKQHVEGIEKANEALAGQLQKVAEIGADVKEVLRIQEVVDGTVKTVTATEEFKQVLEALQKHLTESDALLREAARPRTIRLVESDGEVQQAAPVAAKAPEEPKASQTSEADSSS